MSYVPDVTPEGKPAKVGVVVATPAVDVPGEAVQQWMWDAVVVPKSPEKDAWTRIVSNVVSTVIVVVPVAGDALGGDSAAPLNGATYWSTAAPAEPETSPAINVAVVINRMIMKAYGLTM